jgi:anti-anti-sigma factor
MRQHVPFIGEELISRDERDQGEAKRRGQLIDEVLSTASDASSWDDLAPPPQPTSARPKASTNQPTPGPISARGQSVNSAAKQAHIDWLLINNGHGLRVNISGTMDQQLRQEWMRLLRETANNGIDQYEFNLTKAPALNLTGLAMLLLFKEQKKSQKQSITLCHCNRQIWELLLWTGMDKYFVIQGATNEKMKP